MKPPKVIAVCPPGHYLLRNLAPLRSETELIVSADEAEIRQKAEGTKVLMYSGLTGPAAPMTAIWPALAPSVRWIHSLSAGVEKVLTPEIVASDVIVTNARGVFKRPLAEFAVLGVLYFYKEVRRLQESQTRRHWDLFSVDLLNGKTLGVVGYGEIGRECALLLKALGMRVYATRRRPEQSANDPLLDRSFAPQELHAMLAECDVVVAAAPHTPATHHLMNDAAFSAMKASAIFINVGRGPVVDEAALIRALEQQRIRAAALDVFEVEPLPPDSPLWGFANVLISPHCTDRTHDPDWLDLSAQLFVRNYHRYRQTDRPELELENVVDKHAGY